MSWFWVQLTINLTCDKLRSYKVKCSLDYYSWNLWSIALKINCTHASDEWLSKKNIAFQKSLKNLFLKSLDQSLWLSFGYLLVLGTVVDANPRDFSFCNSTFRIFNQFFRQVAKSTCVDCSINGKNYVFILLLFY